MEILKEVRAGGFFMSGKSDRILSIVGNYI